MTGCSPADSFLLLVLFFLSLLARAAARIHPLTYPLPPLCAAQVSISGLHVRYEDDVSHHGHPFAAGLTIDAIAAETTDEHFRPAFAGGMPPVVHKLASLSCLSMYLDTVCLRDMCLCYAGSPRLLPHGTGNEHDCRILRPTGPYPYPYASHVPPPLFSLFPPFALGTGTWAFRTRKWCTRWHARARTGPLSWPPSFHARQGAMFGCLGCCCDPGRSYFIRASSC